MDFICSTLFVDNPSIGKKYEGHKGIRQYFDNYFIGYHTHTDQVKLKIIDEANARLEVLVIGDFSEGKIVGTFEFKFKN